MVGMLVGDKDEVGLGKRGVVGDVAVGIDVDRLAAEGHHQGAVAEERDLEVALAMWGRRPFRASAWGGGQAGQAEDEDANRTGRAFP